MDRDDVIRMAREAGFKPEFFSPEGIDMWEHFARLVAAHEREACAMVAQDYWSEGYCDDAVREIAAEIRARGEQ